MKKVNKGFLVGSLAVIGAAFLWSLDGTFIRPQFYQFDAKNIVFLEHFLGFIVLSPFIFLSGKRILNIKRKDLAALLWVCLFGGLIGTLAITKAFFAAYAGDATLSTIIILQKLQPIFALFLARIILKEYLHKCFYCWAAIGIISAYFISFPDWKNPFMDMSLISNASVLAIIAAFAFGSSTVFGKRLVTDLGFELSTALRFGLTSILAFITVLCFGDIYSINNLTILHWQLLVLIVFSSGALALLLYYYGLKKTSASAATIFELTWPLSAIFFDYYFNGNILTPIQIVASLVLVSSFFMIIKSGKKQLAK